MDSPSVSDTVGAASPGKSSEVTGISPWEQHLQDWGGGSAAGEGSKKGTMGVIADKNYISHNT